jgi:metal-responsive CopG/Arc/MetJ family transcriptional regulator
MASKNKETKERDKTVNVPIPMVNRIEEIIAKEELGFRTKTDFVRNAIREGIIKYNRILKDLEDGHDEETLK